MQLRSLQCSTGSAASTSCSHILDLSGTHLHSTSPDSLVHHARHASIGNIGRGFPVLDLVKPTGYLSTMSRSVPFPAQSPNQLHGEERLCLESLNKGPNQAFRYVGFSPTSDSSPGMGESAMNGQLVAEFFFLRMAQSFQYLQLNRLLRC